MSRTADTILARMIARLHVGFALGRRGGVFDAILGAFADLTADIEAEAEAMIAEVDPRRASNFLEDFERVLGPDPCGRDLSDLTVSQRQALAHQRWTANGGQSTPYMIGLAKKLDEDVEIFEFWPSKAGGLRAGQRLIGDGEQFLYMVRLEPEGETTNFRAGASRAGERLGDFTVSGAECELRRVRPAHTTISFSYVDFLTIDGERIAIDGDELTVAAA